MQQFNLQKTSYHLTEFKEVLFDPVIDLADIFDYNGKPMLLILPYLRKHRLLPFFPKGKQQLKISLAQLIWLRIIDTLRQFSYKVTDMQKLCSYFFEDAYRDDLALQNIEYNIEQIAKAELAGTANSAEVNTMKKLKSFTKDRKLLDALKLDINYLSNLIIQCIESREDTGMLIFPGGRVLEYDSQGQSNHNDEPIDINEPHIRLSISYYLREFINDEELSNLLMPRLLNSDELKVLQALNNKNIVELNIKKRENGRIRIDTITMGVINGEKAKEIRRILGLGNYEEIEMSTRDQKTLQFKKTKKNLNSD
jgi:hypothetical protein